jgi:hypothetical protein
MEHGRGLGAMVFLKPWMDGHQNILTYRRKEIEFSNHRFGFVIPVIVANK